MANIAPTSLFPGNRLRVLAVRDYQTQGGEARSHFSKVGVAFPLRNKPGFKIHLDAIPLSGELLLMPDEERKEAS